MAGRGTRLRPHTLTTPKPLIKVVGKPIVQWLVEDLAKMARHEPIEEIAYVIGDFGKEVEQQLLQIAEKLGAKGSIYYQEHPLGTAHAIYCAHESLQGNVIVAFADTLFKADFEIKDYYDGMIYVQKVENPSAFGVVKVNEQNLISEFVEKPKEFVSDLAIVGIYYFSRGEYLKKHLQYLLDNNIMVSGEYQLTTALENMRAEGAKLAPGQVEKWLDCGNKDITLQTNGEYMGFLEGENLIAESASISESVIVLPVFIGENTVIQGSVVGPYTSVGDGCVIKDSILKSCLIQEKTQISSAILHNSMIGNHVKYTGSPKDLSLGDFCVVKE
jgi:glucose-1-phosphate thymidylyltransferase